jgi:hypothetical protein
MLKPALILLILATCAAALAAQTQGKKLAPNPDFTGTWVVDEDFEKAKGSQTWIIRFADNEFRVEKIYHFAAQGGGSTVTLFTDKRGEINTSLYGEKINSKSYLKDGKLIREYRRNNRDPLHSSDPLGGPTYSTATVTETYYLSKDGSKLIFRRDDDSRFPNRNTPVKMGRGFEDKIILRRKN